MFEGRKLAASLLLELLTDRLLADFGVALGAAGKEIEMPMRFMKGIRARAEGGMEVAASACKSGGFESAVGLGFRPADLDLTAVLQCELRDVDREALPMGAELGPGNMITGPTIESRTRPDPIDRGSVAPLDER